MAALNLMAVTRRLTFPPERLVTSARHFSSVSVSEVRIKYDALCSTYNMHMNRY